LKKIDSLEQSLKKIDPVVVLNKTSTIGSGAGSASGDYIPYVVSGLLIGCTILIMAFFLNSQNDSLISANEKLFQNTNDLITKQADAVSNLTNSQAEHVVETLSKVILTNTHFLEEAINGKIGQELADKSTGIVLNSSARTINKIFSDHLNSLPPMSEFSEASFKIVEELTKL